MLRVGIAGIGFMGMIHYLCYQKTRGVKVAAICEQDQRRLTGDWRGIQGNFGPAGTQMDLKGVATYDSLDALLADDSLDLIDVTLPPALHADVSVRALKAGKHVFCEKPMSLTLAECNRMSRAAKGADRQLLIGHVLPFFPEYQWAWREIQSGRHGKLLGGTFKRVISDPHWLNNYWRADVVGGPLLDLHVHDAHFIRLVFGMPKGVTTCGRTRNALPEYWHTQFEYGSRGPTVEATSGIINQPGRSFNHGFEIHLEHATLLFEFAVMKGEGLYLCPPTILSNKGDVERPQLSDGNPMAAFEAEIAEVVRCLRRGVPSAILNSSLAQDAILLCQQQSESLRQRKPVALSYTNS
jgi:predicted dehydrogenase